MTTRLVYTGSLPVSLASVDAYLSPGDEFSVSDHLKDSFLARADMSLAPEVVIPEPEEPAAKPKKNAQPEQPAGK